MYSKQKYLIMRCFLVQLIINLILKYIEILQKEIWKHSDGVETHTVETHIYRLRKKINGKFKNNNFIINNKKGYKLVNWKKEIL